MLSGGNTREDGRELVATTDLDSRAGGSQTPNGVQPAERRTLIDGDDDDYARYVIGNDDVERQDSYEAEEDAAHTVTGVYRRRKKQQRKSAVRMCTLISLLIMLLAGISLGIFFLVRSQQQQQQEEAYNSAPAPTTEAPISSYNDNQVPFGFPPQSMTDNAAREPALDLKYICGTEPNRDLSSCREECYKGTCCWLTNSCRSDIQCSAYLPCDILMLSDNNHKDDNTNEVVSELDYGGCASVSADTSSTQPFQCYPIFLPCRTDKDCETQMLSLGVFFNCTRDCGEATYTALSNVNNQMNFTDTMQAMENIANSLDNSPSNGWNASSAWNRITFDDFQSGWGNFKDGGNDAKLLNVSIVDGDETNVVARLRDNSKESVMTLKDAKDVTKFKVLGVNFWLKTKDLQSGDMLVLEYSSDGGKNWEMVKEWIFGDPDFVTNDYAYKLNALFYDTDYNFSSNGLLRFRSDADNNDRIFYLDDVEFSGAYNIPSENNIPTTVTSDAIVEEQNNTIWKQITFDDFESGWGNFRDGGKKSALLLMSIGEVQNHMARIQCCGETSILPMEHLLDVSPYRALRVTFLVEADGLEPGDMLLLEYSPDGGSVWEVVKEWIFGVNNILDQQGIPIEANVTFFSTDYLFSSSALIRFRSDANSGNDIFLIDNVELAGAVKIDNSTTAANDIMAVKFSSYCGARKRSSFVCNPANVPCHSDRDCFEDLVAAIEAANVNCGDDPECIRRSHGHSTNSDAEYVFCLTECDQSAVNQQWEIITSDNFQNGYGNFVDKGGDSIIVPFTNQDGVESQMVQIRNDNGVNSSLPLRDYYDVTKYAALRVNVTLVFDGIEAGDTLVLEYAPDSSTWNIVEEWVFGGFGANVMNENNIPYVQEAVFYDSPYTAFTSGARIRFRSLGNSINDHFLIGNVVFSGLKK